VGLGVTVMGALTSLKEDSKDEGEETDQDLSSQCSSSSESEDEDDVETEVITDTFDHLLLEQLYDCSHTVV